MSPTQRTLKLLREDNWLAQVVERWNPFAHVRQDLFGVIDVVAVRPGEILGVQCCAASSAAARLAKAVAEPKLRAWLEAGGSFVVHSWGKRGGRGERKLWTCSVRPVTLGDLDGAAEVA